MLGFRLRAVRGGLSKDWHHSRENLKENMRWVEAVAGGVSSSIELEMETERVRERAVSRRAEARFLIGVLGSDEDEDDVSAVLEREEGRTFPSQVRRFLGALVESADSFGMPSSSSTLSGLSSFARFVKVESRL